MLRECHRVLKPASRMVGYLIHARDGLTESERNRAAVLGPSCVMGLEASTKLAEVGGLTVIDQQDVTARFHDTCAALLLARREMEGELRHEEGDTAYDYELASKRDMLRGIDDGLLIRSLITAVKEP